MTTAVLESPVAESAESAARPQFRPVPPKTLVEAGVSEALVDSLGYGFQNGFRTEAEFGYRNNDFEDFDGDATALSLMANLFYDFNRDGNWHPYLGVGVGGAQVSVDGGSGPITFDDDDDTVLAYQALAGIAFPISDRLQLDVGYRYFVDRKSVV